MRLWWPSGKESTSLAELAGIAPLFPMLDHSSDFKIGKLVPSKAPVLFDTILNYLNLHIWSVELQNARISPLFISQSKKSFMVKFGM